MKFVLKDNSALAIIVGQAFLSVVFIYVSMETRLSEMETSMNTRFAGVEAQLTVINIRLDRLEEGQEEMRKDIVDLKENQRAIIRLLERMDQRVLNVEVLALQNKKEILLMKPQTADTRNQLAAVQEQLDYLDQLGRTRTYINPSEPYAPPTDG